MILYKPGKGHKDAKWLYVIILIALCMPVFWRPNTAPLVFSIQPQPSLQAQQATFKQLPLNGSHYPYQHAVSLLALENKNVMAVWYAGSAEHKKDVSLQMAIWKRQKNQWTLPKTIMTRDIFMKNHRAIHTLGNPLLINTPGKIALFFVSTMAGWSTSCLNVITSQDQGQHWSVAHTLYTSPFFNLSTLLRGSAVPLKNNKWALPVYHELFDKNALMLVLNKNLQAAALYNISWNHHTLQPWIVVRSAKTAWAFMRSNRQHIFWSTTHDAGMHWSRSQPLSIQIPDAGISASAWGKRVILAYNTGTKNRQNMSLAIGVPQKWHIIPLWHRDKNNITDYPYLIQWPQQNSWLMGFSNHKHRQISCLHFNASWLQQQGASS